MKKSQFLGAVCATALVVLANNTHATQVSQLLGVDIGGTLYDVTFHTTTGDTFNGLWDADDDGVFGGGGSVFSKAPTFWGDITGASAAATAIASLLGTSDSTVGAFNDNFLIPYALAITSGADIISSYTDDNGNLTPDILVPKSYWDYQDLSHQAPYASFEVSAVPVPAAVWLFGSGLLGLAGIARRKKAA